MTSNLIDWRLVGFSALWILGLSVLLATVSFADYTAHVEQGRTRNILKRSNYLAAIYAGMTLFAAGLAGVSRTVWETALWIVLAVVFAYLTWHMWRTGKESPKFQTLNNGNPNSQNPNPKHQPPN